MESTNSFPTIIKIEKSYVQTTIFFIYFQKQTIGSPHKNQFSSYTSAKSDVIVYIQELIIMQNYTSQLIKFP